MPRQRLSIATALILFTAVPAAAGDWWTNYWTDWHRNNAWTEPFIYPDRASVCRTFDLQIAKGWQMQNLLGDHHFEAEGNRLSPAGMIKLRTILTQNPNQFRSPYVQRGLTDEITTRRLASTQQAAADIVHGPFPDVFVSDTQLVGTSAEYVNGVNTWFTGFMQGISKPQPEAFQVQSTGSYTQ
jgi:hypothetical protein